MVKSDDDRRSGQHARSDLQADLQADSQADSQSQAAGLGDYLTQIDWKHQPGCEPTNAQRLRLGIMLALGLAWLAVLVWLAFGL